MINSLTVLGTIYTSEGDVFGPLAPIRSELQAGGANGTLIIGFLFRFVNTSDGIRTAESLTIHVANNIRHPAIEPQLMYPGDDLFVTYALNSTFDTPDD